MQTSAAKTAERVGERLSSDQRPDRYGKLKQERDRFVALAFCAADLLFEVDDDLTIVYATGACSSLLGQPSEAVLGRPFFDLIDELDAPLIEELVRAMRGGHRLGPVAVRLGPDYCHRARLALMGYHLPQLPNSFFFALRKSSQSEAAGSGKEPGRDPSTGLLEIQSFATLANERIRLARARGEELKLTMIRMAKVSDLRSRLAPDASEALSSAIGACLRVAAGQNEIAGQFDDGNYGVLHTSNVDIPEIQARIEDHTRSADPAGVGASIASGTVPASLLETNEIDMVKALVHTINDFCDTSDADFKDGDVSSTLEKIADETNRRLIDFRSIIATDTFDVAFQPIVDVKSLTAHHFEALARFGGASDQSPYELITFAENSGLICDFDLAMCRKVLDMMEVFKKEGDEFHVAVNISGRSIGSEPFLGALRKLLSMYPTTRHGLVFELTESSQIRNLRMANEFIQELRRAGHKVCLDDFGAGATAMRYLQELDVDTVKIDGYYIDSAAGSGKRRAFLKHMAALCNELGIDTVAERVEDQDTLSFVRECGIGFAQGYLFGKPARNIRDFDKQFAGVE